MSDHTIDRRAFLRTTLATAAAILLPHGANRALAADELARLSVEDFPELEQMYRSARLMIGANGRGVLVTRVGPASYVAVADACTREGCPVDDLDEKTLSYTCPCDGSRYDMTGAVTGGPATVPLERFDAVREGNTIIIRDVTSGVEMSRSVVGLDEVRIGNGRAELRLRLERAAGVRFLLYTLEGREAMRIDAGRLGPGEQRLTGATTLPAGAYVGLLEVDGRPRLARKLMVP